MSGFYPTVCFLLKLILILLHKVGGRSDGCRFKGKITRFYSGKAISGVPRRALFQANVAIFRGGPVSSGEGQFRLYRDGSRLKRKGSIDSKSERAVFGVQ